MKCLPKVTRILSILTRMKIKMFLVFQLAVVNREERE